MSAVLEQSQTGHRNRRLNRANNGERRYTVIHRVKTNDKNDGPQVVLNTPGLPAIGSVWNFGNDLDIWAFATPELTITPDLPNEPNFYWSVEQVFKTPDPADQKNCADETIEDPLLKPQEVSGGFTRFTEEITEDRFGNIIQSSSFEPLKGPIVQFDVNRAFVRIEQNVVSLGATQFTSQVDTVNNATLWGFGPRQVKLSNVTWSRRTYGTCSYYYTRTFEFETNTKTFDRLALDEGNKVLSGKWNTECTEWIIDAGVSNLNPLHFQRFHDCKGNLMRAILDGKGEPIDPVGTGTGTTEEAHRINIQYYPESNFLLLGIPSVIDL